LGTKNSEPSYLIRTHSFFFITHAHDCTAENVLLNHFLEKEGDSQHQD